MDVQNLVLPAAEEAESIWTKKFGFRKMTEERVSVFFDTGSWRGQIYFYLISFLWKISISNQSSEYQTKIEKKERKEWNSHLNRLKNAELYFFFLVVRNSHTYGDLNPWSHSPANSYGGGCVIWPLSSTQKITYTFQAMNSVWSLLRRPILACALISCWIITVKCWSLFLSSHAFRSEREWESREKVLIMSETLEDI